MKKIRFTQVHYVLSSHWDREWYQTFQHYRRRLVRLLDRVLDDLDGGTLRGPFTTDGQAIVLEDYLEIRPERRAQLERFTRTGRLSVGPWYVLPDEWLVSGESIIRNLRLGREIAREFGGEPSSVCFVCDLFGHIGQMPQIARNFGIKVGLVWRGVEPRKTAHFRWRGVDGTEMLCYRFGRAGYCDYTWDVRHSFEPKIEFDPATALADLKTFLAKETARASDRPVLLFDGGDHLEYDAEHYRLLFATRPGPDFPYDIRHGTLGSYFDDILNQAESITDLVEGELRAPGRRPGDEDQQLLIPGVLSSRVWIKQANDACQTLLCAWAEPFAALAATLTGAPVPQRYLDLAWRWLLKNHPHDSICGCSIDEVHQDMRYRFAQCRQIAEAQVEESLRALATAVEGELEGNALRLLVANPLACELDEPVQLVVQIPVGWGTFQEFMGYEPKPAFRLFGSDGAELSYQVLDQAALRMKVRLHPLKFPEPYKTHDVTIAVRLRLPALGYATLTVREGTWREKSGPIIAAVTPVRHPSVPGLATSERSAENELIAVTIEANGTLTLTDKRNGRTYPRLLTFEDNADIGDGWYHGQAVNDQRFNSTAAGAEVALVQDGPLVTQFRIRTTLRLPASFDFGLMRRSEEYVPVQLDTRVTLRAGVDRIEVHSTVDNTARDHRLRVLFGSGAAAAKTYLADGAFDVIERPIALPPDNHLGRELAVETTPQQCWTAVTDDDGGLAVLATGLHESAVIDQPHRPIALTLFRCTRRTVFTDGQPDGQLLGRLEFEYWLMPLAGAPDRRRLSDAGLQLAASLRTVQLEARDLVRSPAAERIPATGSLVRIEGKVVATSVRQVGQALEVRVFNPTTASVRATLEFPAFKDRKLSVGRVDFESQNVRRPETTAGSLQFTLAPKEIATFSCQAQHRPQRRSPKG